MDNRLVLAILFVALSWLSVGTYAQSNSTTTAQNMTAMSNNATNATTTNMTAMSNNMANATTNMTAMSNNMANATTNMTAMSNNMANATTNMTAMSNNMANVTAQNMTTMGNNTTNATMAQNMTTMGNNTTNATMAQNVTTMGNNTVATAAPPLTPNTTVEALETPVNNSGCGTEQLCAAEPSSCNPANSGSCFFLGAKRLSGQNFEFALSGESDGYLAASLSTDSTQGGNDTTYVCANNNSNVQFFGALLNNGQLTLTELNVNSVRGRVTGNRIQCTFAATVPAPTARTTSFALTISTGQYNATSGDLGAPTARLQSPVVNLANPNTTVTNDLSTNNSTNATTSPPTTTGHATALQQSLTQALLISAGLLGLAML